MRRKDTWPDKTAEFYQRTGAQLKAMRENKFLTQTDAAASLDISSAMLCNIEKGNRKITLDRFDQILRLYSNRSTLDI
jgi:DNA-binding XRE family transcriptional regulator